MKKILPIILLVVPLLVSAQRIELYTYNSFKYIALYSYGLQRNVVKTNDEMRAAQSNGDGTGVLKRHHTTKGIDERIGDDGYSANDKVTFAFIVAPRNVKEDGSETTTMQWGDVLSWSRASGWDPTTDAGTGESYDLTTGVGIGESNIAESPTGCAAYKGPQGKDKPGTWRLPTQREMQVMFTVIEQSMGYIASNQVDHQIIQGIYWTATEFYASGAPGYAWSISSITGQPRYDLKTEAHMVRCIRDIYEPINE